jgi:biopolymer transport protein ExbD
MWKNFKKIKKHISNHKKRYLIILCILIILILTIGGILVGYSLSSKNQKPQIQEQSQKNIYVEFISEIYDKIQENYWNKIPDEELANLFKLGAEKLTQAPQNLSSADKNGVSQMIINIMDKLEETKRKEFAPQLAHLVLVNLKPFGRSALYVKKDEENLKNKVENVNPETGKIEPTVSGELVRTDILHLYISKMSPTTVEDLKNETEKFDNIEGLNTLILDLRGNIGGSLDVIQYLLGPFIGPNRYAFELFQQADYDPFKTKLGWMPSLVRYKKVVILADNNTQSSAEVMLAALKEYNVGVFVGTKTKGWGTIEMVYELKNQINPDEKYSVFLVNHLTLRDDNQPIEGAGVEPTIDINDPKWKDKLNEYFNDNELIKAVEETWNKKRP